MVWSKAKRQLLSRPGRQERSDEKGKRLETQSTHDCPEKAWEDLYEAQYQVNDPLLRPHEVEYMKGILAHKEKDYQRANDELRAYMNEKGGKRHA